MDGLGYDEDGHPQTDRELRYNWFAVIRRPVNMSQYAAELTIVVFDNRPHLFTSVGSEQVLSTPNPPAPGTAAPPPSGAGACGAETCPRHPTPTTERPCQRSTPAAVALDAAGRIATLRPLPGRW